MSPKHILVIAIVSGIIFVVVVYNTISEELAVILAFLATVILVAGLVIERAYHRPDRFVEQLGEADILNRMWFPLQEELTDVVRTGGRVTEASSAWATAPRLSKRETPRTFFSGMQRYLRQRERVASFAASDLATEDGRQQLEAEQQGLLFMAQELHKEVNKAIEAITGRIGSQKDPKHATETFVPTATGHRDQAKPRIKGGDATIDPVVPKRTGADRDPCAYHSRAPCSRPARARSHENRGYGHDVRTRQPHTHSLGTGTAQGSERASSAVPSSAYTAEDHGCAQAAGADRYSARSS